jgi:hypothetical protein
MTTDRRALLVRTLKRVSLVLVLAGLAFGVYAANDVRGPSPAQQLKIQEDLERYPAAVDRDPQLLAELRIRRDAGRLSTWRPIDLMAVAGFTIFGGPIILLGGVVWWIAHFIQAGQLVRPRGEEQDEHGAESFHGDSAQAVSPKSSCSAPVRRYSIPRRWIVGTVFTLLALLLAVGIGAAGLWFHTRLVYTHFSESWWVRILEAVWLVCYIWMLRYFAKESIASFREKGC